MTTRSDQPEARSAPTPRVRPATTDDATAVARIYNHAIEHTVASFWESPRPVEELAGLIAGSSVDRPFLVAELDDRPAGQLAGAAWAKPWNPRDAYRHTLELSVYVDAACQRRGVGRALYGVLIPQLRDAGHRSVIGLISLPNPASVALHEAFGLAHVGTIREAGHKHGRWVDVGLWQGMLGPVDL